MIGNVLRGSIGNLVEWYDWYVYSAFSFISPRPSSRRATDRAIPQHAAVFAVGFLMRPIGGWLLGRFADRYGRRAHSWCVALMAAARCSSP